MAEPVTTYIFTFKSSVPDDAERRANLNRFLKAAKRAYCLRLVKMRIEDAQPVERAAATKKTAKKAAKYNPNYNQIFR